MFSARSKQTVSEASADMNPLLLLLLLRFCQTSARHRVMVLPSRSQYFEHEQVSVSCEQFSPGWTVWRYTTEGSEPVLSQCGSGWGSQTSSTCSLTTVKVSDGGAYWCESKHRDSSNVVNITVTDRKVILQSPPLPVMEGDNVTLHCKTSSSDQPAEFFKNNVTIMKGSTSQMTIHNFSRSDEGAYKCGTSEHRESPSSWLLMEDDSAPASITASPDSSQLFEYENLTLSCGHNSRSHGWEVIRALTSGDKLILQSCGKRWGTPTDSGCELRRAKRPDSAIYWCESPARQRSNSVNITVYDDPVILQSPALPVTGGGNVTLHCRAKTPPSNRTAAFYKEESLISIEPAGNLTLHRVSQTDEGSYRCGLSSHGESPPSWLFVRDAHDKAHSSTDPTVSVLTVIRHLVVFSPYCISTVLVLSFRRHRPSGRNLPVSMTMSSPHQDDEGLDRPYDDVTADITTEHHF